jgi:hypothetical protein
MSLRNHPMKIWVAAAALIGALSAAPQGAAQTICGHRAELVAELARINAETPKALGLSAGGELIELLVAPNGDWTILVTFPNRETCFVATGAFWERLPNVASASPEL